MAVRRYSTFSRFIERQPVREEDTYSDYFAHHMFIRGILRTRRSGINFFSIVEFRFVFPILAELIYAELCL